MRIDPNVVVHPVQLDTTKNRANGTTPPAKQGGDVVQLSAAATATLRSHRAPPTPPAHRCPGCALSPGPPAGPTRRGRRAPASWRRAAPPARRGRRAGRRAARSSRRAATARCRPRWPRGRSCAQPAPGSRAGSAPARCARPAHMAIDPQPHQWCCQSAGTGPAASSQGPSNQGHSRHFGMAALTRLLTELGCSTETQPKISGCPQAHRTRLRAVR